MAQFDVYANPSKQTRNAYPFILDMQHSLIEDITTRIVVPLGDAKKFRNEELKGLTPKIKFEGKNLLVLIPQIASMPKNSLKNPVGTLLHLRDELIAALDLAITGI
ncbi:MAG: CcdB family protein [Gammaproteobacteria bacterium]|nr:CcdB family protein [Gammaproteobacteria bacterium]